MTDDRSPERRSYSMSRIRGRGNESTEQALARLLRKAKVKGWRRHLLIRGRPDFVFQKHRVLIFVDGCFWHGCPRCFRLPLSNVEYWEAKISRNKARDRATSKALRKDGWKVVRVWEHTLVQNSQAAIKRIQRAMI